MMRHNNEPDVMDHINEWHALKDGECSRCVYFAEKVLSDYVRRMGYDQKGG